MITRAQIRRQLRKNGGIMNAVPRQGYFLGGVGDFIGDALGKVGKVAKQVVKSPVGKAALLGLGAYGLGGGFGGNFGLGNIGAKIGGAKNFLFGQKFGDLGIAGPARLTFFPKSSFIALTYPYAGPATNKSPTFNDPSCIKTVAVEPFPCNTFDSTIIPLAFFDGLDFRF